MRVMKGAAGPFQTEIPPHLASMNGRSDVVSVQASAIPDQPSERRD
jgi:hypothetical protein